MRFSMRLKVVSVLAALFVLFAGCAWADIEDDVEDAINDYDSSLNAVGDNSGTITVTGSAFKSPNDILELGDITGLIIDWKADLTVTPGGYRRGKGYGMINFDNGEFKLTGGTIQLPTSRLPSGGDQWVDAIFANGGATVTVDGGTVTGARATDTGINVEKGTLIINSGRINIPNGNAVIAGDLLGHTSLITGVAFVSAGNDVTAHVYGNTTTVTDSEVFFEKYDPGDFSPDSMSYIAENGAVWNVEGVLSDMRNVPSIDTVSITVKDGATLNLKNTDLTFKGTFYVEQNGILNVGVAPGDTSHLTHYEGTAVNYGTINIYGTLTNLDEVINYGTINNNSGNTYDNQGRTTNYGIFYNAPTGKTISSGSFDNAKGKIINEGTFQAVQTAEEMGGEITGNAVQPINSSGGSGCDAGFGPLGLLLLAAFAVRKRFLTA